MRCAAQASDGPNHLESCALQVNWTGLITTAPLNFTLPAWYVTRDYNSGHQLL